ncbi:kinase-like protein [Agrocybe pediades]|nr:kinase-like protein [Agrocybe pediades]
MTATATAPHPAIRSVQTDVIRILSTPGSHFDVIQEGPFATVSRVWTTIEDGVPQWIVVKSATTLRKFSREPHDIVKELRLLSSMLHPNIVFTMGSFRDDEQNLLSIYMPYFPISLSSILASPYFSPHPFPPSTNVPEEHASQLCQDQFLTIAKGIMIQTLDALAFLHDAPRRIGHRDIKPENIMLTKEGCVKLIDFGVSWKENEAEVEKTEDLWPEYKGKLYFEVSTRAYRAPELLFGTRHYDQCAIDLWSVGATFAEFFTALRLESGDDDDDDEDEDEEDEEREREQDEDTRLAPFIVPRYLRIGYPGAQWKRDTLFNGERGEIGLAWSIFKIFGTPTEENWPGFEELPGATSVVFNVVESVPLAPLFPNLPPSRRSEQCDLEPTSSPSSSSVTSTTSSTSPSSLILDLISSFLVYPSANRIRAEDAMRHPFFTESASSSSPASSPATSTPATTTASSTSSQSCPSATQTNAKRKPPSRSAILLPPGYALEKGSPALREHVVYEWEGKSLGEWLDVVLVSGEGGAEGR